MPKTSFHKDTSTKGHYSVCRDCRATKTRRVIIELISNARKRAKKRGLPCDITREYIEELNILQDGKCAYSGVTLNWRLEPSGKQRVCPPDRVSLDRIDSTKGYVHGNVHLVTDFVNRIKTWYPEEDFFEFCRLVLRSAR